MGQTTISNSLPKGLLAPYKLPEAQLARIPKEIFGIPVYDPEYRWYGAALSSFGIMYNEELRALLNLPEIRTWDDLTHPEAHQPRRCS